MSHNQKITCSFAMSMFIKIRRSIATYTAMHVSAAKSVWLISFPGSKSVHPSDLLCHRLVPGLRRHCFARCVESFLRCPTAISLHPVESQWWAGVLLLRSGDMRHLHVIYL